MYKKVVILLILLMFLILCIGIFIGSFDISFVDIILIIGYKVFSILLFKYINVNVVFIIWNLRLFRVFLVFIVGGLLLVSGVVV